MNIDEGITSGQDNRTIHNDPLRNFRVKTKRKLDILCSKIDQGGFNANSELDLPTGILPMMHLTHTQTKKTMENEGDWPYFEDDMDSSFDESFDEGFFKNIPALGFSDKREEAARFEIDMTDANQIDNSMVSVLDTLQGI